MLKIALNNITRRRNNSILTVICIAITVGLFTLLWSVFSLSYSGLELSKSRLGADVLIYPKRAQIDDEKLLFSGLTEMVYLEDGVVPRTLGDDLKTKVEGISSQFFLETLPSAGCCETNESLRIVGVDWESDFILKAWLEEEGIQSLSDQEIIVGSDLRDEDGLTTGKTTTLLNNSFTVKGVLYKTGTGMDRTIFMDLDTARKLAAQIFPPRQFGVESFDSAVTCYLLKLKEGIDVTAFVRELEGTNTEVNVVAVGETQSNVRAQIALFSQTLFLFWVAVLVLCGLALVSIFRGLIYGRRKEIGYLRSIGMKRREVCFMFLLEIGLLGTVGGLVGAGAGVLLVNPLLNQLEGLITFPTGTWSVGIAFLRLMGGWLLSLLLCALTTVVPVYNLAKLAPYDAIAEGEL